MSLSKQENQTQTFDDERDSKKMTKSESSTKPDLKVEVTAVLVPQTNKKNMEHRPYYQTHPPSPGEYDVMLPCDSPIGISRNDQGQVVFVRHHCSSTNHDRISTAEKYGFIRHKGDIIVSVAGNHTEPATCDEVTKLMKEGWEASFQSANQRDKGLLHMRFRDCTYKKDHTKQLPLEAERKHLHRYVTALRIDIAKRKCHLEYLERFVRQKEGELETMMNHDLQWMERKKRQSLFECTSMETRKRAYLDHAGKKDKDEECMGNQKHGLVSPSCSYEETDEKSKRARYEEPDESYRNGEEYGL